MFAPVGVLGFALFLIIYVGVLSYGAGVWPWELSVYRKEKAAKD